MCGIAGVIAPSGLTLNSEYRDALSRASVAIARRGPDGEGYWEDSRALLALRRLAIIDPDPRSGQPFAGKKAAEIGLGKREGLPLRRVGLVRHLKRVAAVAEQRRLVRQDQPEPGRPGEAADKGETLLRRRNLLALEHVLAPDIPAVQAAPGEDLTKRVERPVGGVSGGCSVHGLSPPCQAADG